MNTKLIIIILLTLTIFDIYIVFNAYQKYKMLDFSKSIIESSIDLKLHDQERDFFLK